MTATLPPRGRFGVIRALRVVWADKGTFAPLMIIGQAQIPEIMPVYLTWANFAAQIHTCQSIAFRFAVSCSLIKCVYNIQKTLKELCDRYSSVYGSLFCKPSGGCLGAVNPSCDAAFIWSLDKDGSSYRYIRLDDGTVYRSANTANDSFSVRCVL